jgi:Transposase
MAVARTWSTATSRPRVPTSCGCGVTAEISPVVAGLYIDGGPCQLLDLQPAAEVSRCERCCEGAVRVLGSIPVDCLTEEDLLTKTCGIDWSEAQHAVAIVDDQGSVLSRARVVGDAVGFGQLLELLAEHGEGEPAPIEIAIETDKGLFVADSVAAGFTVFPINRRSAARYRERHGQAGGKIRPRRCGHAGQHLAHRPARPPAAVS